MLTPARLSWLFNFAGFQAGWFACVLGGAWGHGLAGATIGAALLLLHLWATPARRAESLLLLAAGAMGAFFDTQLIRTGAVQFNDGGLGAALAPAWMIVLWMLFAATLNVSLRWMQARLLLATIAGALAGPVAYLGGEGLGAMTVFDRPLLIALLIAGWSLAVPALAALSRRLDGFGETATYRFR